MKINVTPDFVTEFAKDIIFPAKCPLCGEAIAIEKRAAMRKTLPLARGAFGSDPARTCASGTDSAPNAVGTNTARTGVPGTVSARTCVPDGMRRILYDGMICGSCLRRFEYIRPPYCAKCGKQLKEDRTSGDGARDAGTAAGSGRTDRISAGAGFKPAGGAGGHESGGLCADCSGKERLFIQCRALFTYDEAARELLSAIKYNSKKEYIDVLALMAADRLGAWIKKVSPDFLVPVPVHKKRLDKRGYNQAEELARGIGFYTGIPVRTDALLRVKNTVAQKELDPGERLENLQSAFEPGAELPSGSTAMLIDDIYTTGSTFEACTESLLLAGAGRVYGICAAAGADIA